MADHRDQIRIELVDVGRADDAPQGVRLRRLLKAALRQLGFRCRCITPIGKLKGQSEPERTGSP